MEVTVEAVEDVEHIHQEDPDFVKNSSKYFRWSTDMTKIVMEGVVNHAKPNVIKRNLKHANVLGSRMPTKTELYNKIAAVKLTAFPSTKVKNTHELRLKVAEYLGEPEDDLKPFIPYHDIVDDVDEKDPRFTIIFTSNKNIGKLKSDRVLQTDATYRLNWFGFPVFVVGKKLYCTQMHSHIHDHIPCALKSVAFK